ncbi:MAG: PAS domain S-box protein [Desulfobacula sp.]|jgi:PAS domain S-box-containing protein
MTKNRTAQEKFNQLRRQAEKLMQGREVIPPAVATEDPMKLIHELQTYQIELELQNEELQTAHEELETSRASYFDLYDSAPAGYITLSEKGLILKANLAAAAMLGEDRSELIRRRFSDFILKEDQDIHYLYRNQLFESKEPMECELRMVSNASVQFWVRLTAAAAQHEGTPACRMILSDITEQKQITDALAFLLTCGLPTTGEDFFESLARYLSKTLGMEYICIDRLEGDGLNAQTVAVYNNGRFETNVNYALKDTPCGEVVGKGICCYPKNVRQLFPKDIALQELMAESYFGTTLIDSKGKQIGLIAVIGHHELTDSKLVESLLRLVATRAASELERRQAEEKLQQYKSIVAGSNDIMALVDTNLVHLAANDALLNAFGKTREEIIGHSVSELVDDEFFNETIRPCAEKCMTGVTVRFSSWLEFPVRGRRYLEIEYSPYNGDDNKIKGFVVNARDNTDLKNARDLLELKQLRLETVLNNIDLSIYITDLKTYEILFMNKYLKQFFSEDLIGKVCWQSFRENQDGPCEFCTNRNLIDAAGKPTGSNIMVVYNQKRDKWYEKNDSVIPWIDGSLVHLGITRDITGQKRLEEKQKRIKTILEEKVKIRTAELEDMNTALKVLLKKREEDKVEIEDQIFANHKFLLFPIINNLKKNLLKPNDQDMMNILESELKNILSPFSKKLSDQMINLTPTEIHVADLIKLGKSNKEISTLLDSSVHTIARHRESIRKKTGLKNKKTNLRSFLMTLQ